MKIPHEVTVLGYTITSKLVFSGAKYAIVGFTTFAIDYILNWLLIEVLLVSYLLAGYLVTPVALLFNFISHRMWSFRDIGSNEGKTTVQVARYIVLIVLNAVSNMVLMYVFYGQLGLPLFWSRVICTALIILWTFPVYRLWVYKPSESFL